jgi:hypothetical protein
LVADLKVKEGGGGGRGEEEGWLTFGGEADFAGLREKVRREVEEGQALSCGRLREVVRARRGQLEAAMG